MSTQHLECMIPEGFIVQRKALAPTINGNGWSVWRSNHPIVAPQGQQMWHGTTLLEALAQACSDLGMEPPVQHYVTVTTKPDGEAVLVSWQDEEHRILDTIWEKEPDGEPVQPMTVGGPMSQEQMDQFLATKGVRNSSLETIQHRNICKVVRALADLCFESPSHPKYGIMHTAVVNSLTASDGLDWVALNLEPLITDHVPQPTEQKAADNTAWFCGNCRTPVPPPVAKKPTVVMHLPDEDNRNVRVVMSTWKPKECEMELLIAIDDLAKGDAKVEAHIPVMVAPHIYDYGNDVFVLFDPLDDGASIIGAYRTFEEAVAAVTSAGDNRPTLRLAPGLVAVPSKLSEEFIQRVSNSGVWTVQEIRNLHAHILHVASSLYRAERVEPLGYLYGSSFWHRTNPRTDDHIRLHGTALWDQPMILGDFKLYDFGERGPVAGATCIGGVSALPHDTQSVTLEDWYFTRKPDGSIIVHDCTNGGVLVQEKANTDRSMPEEVLWQLSNALITKYPSLCVNGAPTIPPTPEAEQRAQATLNVISELIRKHLGTDNQSGS